AEDGIRDDLVTGVQTCALPISTGCRFRDCGHRSEPGCAVAAAIDDGRLDPARFLGWRKLEAEARRQLLRVDARARAQQRSEAKEIGRASCRERGDVGVVAGECE